MRETQVKVTMAEPKSNSGCHGSTPFTTMSDDTVKKAMMQDQELKFKPTYNLTPLLNDGRMVA